MHKRKAMEGGFMIKKYNDKNPDWRLLVRQFWPGMRADAQTSDLFSYLQLTNNDVSAICATTPRTVRRWLAGDCPAWVPLHLLALSGYLLHWPGWMVRNGRLIGSQASSTRHAGLTPDMVSDFGCALQAGRLAATTAADLRLENDRLRLAVSRFETRAAVPANVILFPGVTAESIFKQQNGA